MSNLVELLRVYARTIGGDPKDYVTWQAADRIEALEAALKTYEAAIEEAEAIFGSEYADQYGPMFELAMKARDARRAALAPEQTDAAD